MQCLSIAFTRFILQNLFSLNLRPSRDCTIFFHIPCSIFHIPIPFQGPSKQSKSSYVTCNLILAVSSVRVVALYASLPMHFNERVHGMPGMLYYMTFDLSTNVTSHIRTSWTV